MVLSDHQLGQLGQGNAYYSPEQWNAGADQVDYTTQPADTSSDEWDWGSTLTAGLNTVGKIADVVGKFIPGQRVNVPPRPAGYVAEGPSFNAVPWIIGGTAIAGVGAVVLLLRK